MNLRLYAGMAALFVALSASGASALGQTTPTVAAPGQGAASGATGSPLGGPAQVSLPLAEYERLVGKPSVTVIDTLRIGGSFSGRDLALVLSGRAAGLWPKVEVLTAPPGVWIYGCEGEAILSRGGGGLFELVPLAPRFNLRCRVVLSGGDRVALETTPAVQWIESQVQDGELVSAAVSASSGEAASNRRGFAVVRVSGGSGEVLKASATARYRVTLQPESTLFTYQIEVMNPNRSHQPFIVVLRSGEHVQKVDAAVSFEPSGTEYKFQLPPGEQTLTLSGTLPRTEFAPPVSASVHYMLIESHPLLRPTISTTAQRISAQETGLAPRYRGGQGFLFSDADRVSWQVLRLEALRTTSFAVSAVSHVFFLSSDGQARGESTLRLDNQGAPALTLPMRAEPTFASLQREPVLLTRDDGGHLWLPLSQGPQEVLVQHRQSLRRLGGIGVGELWLPQLTVPASNASVELRYSREWVPLYEEFSAELRLPMIEVGTLLGLLLLILWIERLLNLLGGRRGLRIATAVLLAAGALTSPWLLSSLCAANLTLSVVLLMPWLSRRRWSVWTAVGALMVGGLICLFGASLLIGARSSAPMSATPATGKIMAVDRNAYRSEEQTVDKPTEPGAAHYQGLPAKFVMPIGNEQSYFQREMLATETPIAAYVVMMSRPTLTLLGSLWFAVGLLLIFLRRRPLQRGFIELWQRLRKPPPAEAA